MNATEEVIEVKGFVGFGKYAMSKWRDLPEDYLDFLISAECRTSDENKAKARQEKINRSKDPNQYLLFQEGKK